MVNIIGTVRTVFLIHDHNALLLLLALYRANQIEYTRIDQKSDQNRNSADHLQLLMSVLNVECAKLNDYVSVNFFLLNSCNLP